MDCHERRGRPIMRLKADQHWAINAVGSKRLSRAFKLALSGQPPRDSNDIELIKNAAFVYEVAIILGRKRKC